MTAYEDFKKKANTRIASLHTMECGGKCAAVAKSELEDIEMQVWEIASILSDALCLWVAGRHQVDAKLERYTNSKASQTKRLLLQTNDRMLSYYGSMCRLLDGLEIRARDILRALDVHGLPKNQKLPKPKPAKGKK